ncbi:DUF3991 domain-containing protein [Streptococcus suis]|nr:DUF3991 domain-containing protein [Streptococcus suis]HEM5552824.1 toprim domain-containing protein [Streptococcus suis]
MASVKELRKVNIVGVAESLGMALEPKGSGYYEWKEHDSLVIDVRKNRFNWFSRDLSGDPIALVQAVREDQTGQPVSFKEAKHYVETGSFPTVDTIDYTRKEFSNYLSRYESKDKTLMNDYLQNERGLSEETIRFFDEKGVLGQANYKNAQGIEPVILFRTLDAKGKMIGGSLQGIVENRELYDRGRLKQIMKHSDGSSGFNVDIGTPKRLIVAEAPIDLMSYYELHKGELNDVRLVAMDGLKEGTISRHYMETLHIKRGKVYEVDHKKTPQALSNIAKTSKHFKQEENQSVITLAVDNDSAGRKFLSRLEDKGIRFVSDLPPLPAGKEKSDWNDYLKQKKKGQLMEHQNKRLTQNKEVEPFRKETRNKTSKTAEEHYFDWFERMAATVQEQLQLPSPPKLASELEAVVEPFITTDLDRLFARRLSLALDTQRVESSQILSVHQAIDQLDKQISERMQEKELRESEIEVIFHSSDEPLLSRYSSGEIIPYTEFVSILYPKNAKLFNENPRTGPTVSFSNDGGTWFGLRTADGQMLVERFRYDVGLEGESVSDRLNGILSSIHLEQIRRFDATFNTPSYIKENHDIGIEVKLYSNQEYIDTIDFNDLFNHTNLEMMANELGHTDLLNPIKTYTVTIAGASLNQDQVDILVNRMIEEGLETSSLKQLLERDEFSLEQYIEQGKVSQDLEVEPQSYVVPKQKEKFPDEERIMTYSELRRENEELVKRLENRIKTGELEVNFDIDAYLYDVFAKLGNSHPFKYINDKRLEVLSPIQPILASIDDKTVDLYKNKGTIEQDSLYQALKSHQRTLGVDVSTRFIGELAIAAYSTNKQLESLSSESFGSYYGNRTLDNLSHSIERILEYPLIETEARDFEYGFMTIPNAIYHYLEEQEGEVILDRATLDTLISRIKDQPFQIVEENQKDVTISKATEKALEQAQEQIKNAEGTIGDFPDNQEAAPLPEANVSQPLNDLSPSQTQPQPLLHFTTKEGEKSIEKRFYHVASQKEIAKLNRYALTIQQTAQWYLDKVADSRIIYLYQDGDSISSLAVQFDRDKFMHLTGIFPYQEGHTAEQTLLDFANGKGDFDSILLANKGATFDKVKVLPELEAIVESDSFYFGDLSEVPKLKRLDLDKAIRSGDEDVLLAMRTVDGTTFPASLMKLRQSLKLQLDSTNQERSVLGVYRYRDSQLDQLSINQEYIKDGGEVFKSILDQVVENLNQSTSSEPNMEEDMVYHNQPSFKGQMQNHPTEKVKLESVDQPSYAQPSSQNKLNELLASKDRAGLAQHLKEGIHQYLDSTQYKEFLKTMSRFPQYSYRNVMLLKAQKPDVQVVTSFKSWKEDFGRSVKRGEKSLRIFAPMVVKVKDPKTGEILKDDKGNDVTRTIFKLVPVFDVSQTEGKELPQPIYQLEGTHENYAKLYRSAKEYAQSKGLRFEFEANLGEANGYYSRKDQKIVIKSGMSEQQTLKTIYHELAHADLHSSKTTDKELKYSHAELQAESVAYIVSNHYGLDTGSYTFGYLASWTEDKVALTDLEAQLEIVQKEAQHLINSLDSELAKQMEQAQELSVEKVESVEKLSFEERLARAEVQSRSLVEQQMKEEDQSKKQEAKQSNQER